MCEYHVSEWLFRARVDNFDIGDLYKWRHFHFLLRNKELVNGLLKNWIVLAWYISVLAYYQECLDKTAASPVCWWDRTHWLEHKDKTSMCSLFLPLTCTVPAPFSHKPSVLFWAHALIPDNLLFLSFKPNLLPFVCLEIPCVPKIAPTFEWLFWKNKEPANFLFIFSRCQKFDLFVCRSTTRTSQKLKTVWVRISEIN